MADNKYHLWRAGAYFRDGAKGYTDDVIFAGIFDQQYAENYKKHTGDLRMIKVDIEEINREIDERIAKLEKQRQYATERTDSKA